jgi:hypothetical protein
MRLEPGECTESLALEVAEAQGVSPEILQQVMQDFRALQEMATDPNVALSVRSLLVSAAGSSVRFQDGASDSSGGAGSAAAAASQQGRDRQLPQQQEQQQDESDAAGAGEGAESLRRIRRRNSSTRAPAGRQQPPDAVAAADAELKQQQVCTLLAQLALDLPLDAKASQPQPQQWPEGHGPAGCGDAAGGVGAVPLCGVVHHLAPGQQPPASHETGSWVYVLRYSSDVWYVGESQVSRTQNGKVEVGLFYVFCMLVFAGPAALYSQAGAECFVELVLLASSLPVEVTTCFKFIGHLQDSTAVPCHVSCAGPVVCRHHFLLRSADLPRLQVSLLLIN